MIAPIEKVSLLSEKLPLSNMPNPAFAKVLFSTVLSQLKFNLELFNFFVGPAEKSKFPHAHLSMIEKRLLSQPGPLKDSDEDYDDGDDAEQQQQQEQEQEEETRKPKAGKERKTKPRKLQGTTLEAFSHRLENLGIRAKNYRVQLVPVSEESPDEMRIFLNTKCVEHNGRLYLNNYHDSDFDGIILCMVCQKNVEYFSEGAIPDSLLVGYYLLEKRYLLRQNVFIGEFSIPSPYIILDVPKPPHYFARGTMKELVYVNCLPTADLYPRPKMEVAPFGLQVVVDEAAEKRKATKERLHAGREKKRLEREKKSKTKAKRK